MERLGTIPAQFLHIRLVVSTARGVHRLRRLAASYGWKAPELGSLDSGINNESDGMFRAVEYALEVEDSMPSLPIAVHSIITDRSFGELYPYMKKVDMSMENKAEGFYDNLPKIYLPMMSSAVGYAWKDQGQ